MTGVCTRYIRCKCHHIWPTRSTQKDRQKDRQSAERSRLKQDLTSPGMYNTSEGAEVVGALTSTVTIGLLHHAVEGVVRVAVVVGSSPGPGKQHLDARALQDRQDGGRHLAELVLVRVEVEESHLEPWQQ